MPSPTKSGIYAVVACAVLAIQGCATFGSGVRSVDSQYDTAVHEAGHAVAAAVLCAPEAVNEAHVHTDRERLREDGHKDHVGAMSWQLPEPHTLLEMNRVHIIVLYAGPAAEQIYRGSSSGYSSDLTHASRLALILAQARGFRGHDMLPIAQEELARGRREAVKLVRHYKDAIRKLADALQNRPPEMRQRVLRSAELHDLLREGLQECPPYPN